MGWVDILYNMDDRMALFGYLLRHISIGGQGPVNVHMRAGVSYSLHWVADLERVLIHTYPTYILEYIPSIGYIHTHIYILLFGSNGGILKRSIISLYHLGYILCLGTIISV